MSIPRLPSTILSACVLALVAFAGCRPHPYAVTTVVRWIPKSDDGRRCYLDCRSRWHACRSHCGGSTSVAIGMGFGGSSVAVGQTSGARGCHHHCQLAWSDCLRSCRDLQRTATRVRFCPPGPGRCQPTDPGDPAMTLPEYCRGPGGYLRPCAPPPPPSQQPPQQQPGLKPQVTPEPKPEVAPAPKPAPEPKPEPEAAPAPKVER